MGRNGLLLHYRHILCATTMVELRSPYICTLFGLAWVCCIRFCSLVSTR